MRDDATLRGFVDRCVACAACRTGCPTFDATLEEGRSGRGRVQLVRAALDGALDPGTDRFEELLSSCSRCGYCARICPVGIPVVDVVDAGRRLIAERRGLPARHRGVVALLKRPALMRAALKALGLWQRVLGRSRGGRFEALPGTGTTKLWPRLSLRRARRGADPTAVPPSSRRVALRVGCRTDAFLPEAADDVAWLLRRAGLAVDVPPAQGCGGSFARALGDGASADALAAAERRTFEAAEVVSLCGACDATPGAFGGVEWSAALEAAGFAGPFRPDRLVPPVVVHAPCTARYGPRGGTSVLALMRAAGVDARPFTGAACCGGAAPFALDAPALSEDLGRRAADAVRAASPGTFVGSDAGCLIQFGARCGADGAPPSFAVMHAATALRRLVDSGR